MINYINKDKVIQAFISEPSEYDKDCPFSTEHGWQVKLLISFQEGGYENFITIDYNSKDECVNAIDKLNLTAL